MKITFERALEVLEAMGYELEQAEQDSVAVVEITYGREPECYVTGNIDDFPEGVFKLYAAPVQRFTSDDVKVAFENGYASGVSVAGVAKEAAEQEPVAWMRLNEKGECEAIEYIGNVDEHLYLPPSCQWLYISPVITMQQEPVATVKRNKDDSLTFTPLRDFYVVNGMELFAAPVRTKDLTDVEIRKLWSDAELDITWFARAVIAADREKNK